jgi:hypothetical protein
VDALCRSDAGEVAVALVGEYQMVGPETLDGSGTSGCSSVCCLNPVYIQIIIGKDRTSNGADADGLVCQLHLFNDFRYKFVNHAVAAARTIVHGAVVHQRRLLVNDILGVYNVFFSHSLQMFCYGLHHYAHEYLNHLQYHASGNDYHTWDVVLGHAKIQHATDCGNNQKGYVQEFPDSLRVELAVPLVADSHDFLFLISELI